MGNDELKKRVELLSNAKKSFFCFTRDIFSKSMPNFVCGRYVEETCNYLFKYDRTMRIAARSHFKSVSFYAFVMYLIMFRGMTEDLDIRYFSCNERMAGEHIQKIKTCIRKNPFFDELIDLKLTAENVASFTWNRKNIINIRPHGVLSFTRGTKADIILCDDLLSDPSDLLYPTVILKINDIFRSVILESLRPGGEIHVIGSPISLADIYYIPEVQKEFHASFYPAIIKDKDGNEVPQWPEFYTLEQIKSKVSVMGEKIFAAEMMLEPYYSTESYFNKEQLRKDIVNPQLRNLKLTENFFTTDLVVAGYDVGKEKNPAEFQVFQIKNGKAIMIHRKEFKKIPYYTGKPYDPLHPSQVEYIREAIMKFCIDKIFYDATRGELEGARECGYLTPHFIPVIFTYKMKSQIATDFGKVVINKQIEILDDEEMLNSICSVTNDFVSVTSSTGAHGDAFWACAMALIGFNAFDASSKQGSEIRLGGKSIFEEDKIPKGF